MLVVDGGEVGSIWWPCDVFEVENWRLLLRTATCFHDGGEIVYHIAHQRSFVRVMMPHTFHEINQVGSPMFGQWFCFRSVYRRDR
jgi:hypothetical protein